jgi:hypothetical protein
MNAQIVILTPLWLNLLISILGVLVCFSAAHTNWIERKRFFACLFTLLTPCFAVMTVYSALSIMWF